MSGASFWEAMLVAYLGVVVPGACIGTSELRR